MQGIGANGNYFKDREEAQYFYESIIRLAEKTNLTSIKLREKNIDDILFILLTYTSEINQIEHTKSQWAYLDELIELYLQLSKRKVNLNHELVSEYDKEIYKENPFENMSNSNKSEFITEELVRVEARMVPPKNNFIYIPNDFEIALKPRECDKGKLAEDIKIPARLSKYIYAELFKEIVEQHKEHNTKFFKMLSSGDINISDIENRTTYKKYARKNLALYNLIERINKYLVSSTMLNSTDIDRYAFIYDLVSLFNIHCWKGAVDRKGRYLRIRDVIRDNAPDSNSGETQLFK